MVVLSCAGTMTLHPKHKKPGVVNAELTWSATINWTLSVSFWRWKLLTFSYRISRGLWRDQTHLGHQIQELHYVNEFQRLWINNPVGIIWYQADVYQACTWLSMNNISVVLQNATKAETTLMKLGFPKYNWKCYPQADMMECLEESKGVQPEIQWARTDSARLQPNEVFLFWISKTCAPARNLVWHLAWECQLGYTCWAVGSLASLLCKL